MRYGLRDKLQSVARIGAVGLGLLGVLKGTGHGIDYTHRLIRWHSITQPVDKTQFDLSKLDAESAQHIEEWLNILKGLPEMTEVFAHLPNKLQFVSCDDGKIAGGFDAYRNVIGVAFSSKQNEITLAHELCHANQACLLLQHDSNKGISFADTFRIVKLAELEARFLQTLVEKRLREQGLISGRESEDCEALNKLIEKFGEQKAKDYFVMAYWTGGKMSPEVANIVSRDFGISCKKWYTGYNDEALFFATAIHSKLSPMNPLFGTLSAQKVADTYVKRMGLTEIKGKDFLSDKDCIHINEKDMSIEELGDDGERICSRMRMSLHGLRPYATRYDKKGHKIEEGFVDDCTASQDTLNSITFLELIFLDRDSPKMSKEMRAFWRAHPSFVNHQHSVSGDTPLMDAISFRNDELIEFLLKKNANLLLKNKEGHTVLDYLRTPDGRPWLKPELESLIRKTYAAQERLYGNKSVVRP